MNDTTAQPRCPVTHGANALAARRSNRDWWPKQLNVSILHQHPAQSNPLGGDFDYA